MDALRAKSLLPFVPSGNAYEAGRRLFKDLGFEELWENGGYAGFRCGDAQFILQRFDDRRFAENFMVRLNVPDLDAWWEAVSRKRLAESYPAFRIAPPAVHPWGRQVDFIDLAGVCWHVGEDRQARSEASALATGEADGAASGPARSRRAIALFASSRRNGNTGSLVDEVARRLDIEVIDLAQEEISAYDYEHRNRGDAFEPLMERVLDHDQIVFASPVYWYSVAPPMKVFLDRICDLLELPDLMEKGRRLRTKCAHVVCTSVYDDVPEPFIAAFRETFDYLGMRFGGYLHANCRNGYVAAASERDVASFVERIRNHGSGAVDSR